MENNISIQVDIPEYSKLTGLMKEHEELMERLYKNVTRMHCCKLSINLALKEATDKNCQQLPE